MTRKQYIGAPNCWKRRKKTGEVVCRQCKMPRTPEGHDPCIADLPGVDFACCGHGDHPGYVAFKNGHVIRGYFDSIPQTKVPSADWNKSVPDEEHDA
jgi:hypothetical protein